MSFLKKEDDEKETNIFKRGTLIDIVKNKNNDIITYSTILYKINSDDEIVVILPRTEDGKIVKLVENFKYKLTFKTENGLYENVCKVIDYDIYDHMPMATLQLLEETKKTQRRSGFRLKINLGFKFYILNNKQEQKITEKDLLLGVTEDISSGGIKFLSNANINEKDKIKVILNIDGLVLVAVGSIISSEKLKDDEEQMFKYCYKCKFEHLSDYYKDELSKYIFDFQREMSKRNTML